MGINRGILWRYSLYLFWDNGVTGDVLKIRCINWMHHVKIGDKKSGEYLFSIEISYVLL